ncbi:MAG: anti-virulence regulator CigR family protein [Gammaproteobacteria bacterium]|nr:hypothetical protein [Pseudomonadales bacterium]MCP5348131.1 hypothetical protein [Pseudomonadales bacterium]
MNRTTTLRCSALLLVSLTLSSCSQMGIYWPIRQGPGGPPGQPGTEASVSVTISTGEARRLAVNYGLTGMRSLPPGIRRNLARGKPLPPGIARQMVPGRMLADLPVVPDHEWRIAGRDLVLIALGTLVVVEILQNVFE